MAKGGIVLRSQAKKLVVKQSRSVPTKHAADCPDCPAKVGEQCVGADGKPSSHCHRARRRMAVRAENQARLSAAAATLDTTPTPQET